MVTYFHAIGLIAEILRNNTDVTIVVKPATDGLPEVEILHDDFDEPIFVNWGVDALWFDTPLGGAYSLYAAELSRAALTTLLAVIFMEDTL